MIVLAWILALLGAIVAYVISLAGAMSTVPQLHWRDALVAVPLPVVAAILAGWRLARPMTGSSGGAARPWLAAGAPFGIAVLTLLFMAQTYFGQPGGPK